MEGGSKDADFLNKHRKDLDPKKGKRTVQELAKTVQSLNERDFSVNVHVIDEVEGWLEDFYHHSGKQSPVVYELLQTTDDAFHEKVVSFFRETSANYTQHTWPDWKQHLANAVACCTQFAELLKRLTSETWKTYSSQILEAGPLELSKTAGLLERISKLTTSMKLVDQLVSVIPRSEGKLTSLRSDLVQLSTTIDDVEFAKKLQGLDRTLDPLKIEAADVLKYTILNRNLSTIMSNLKNFDALLIDAAVRSAICSELKELHNSAENYLDALVRPRMQQSRCEGLSDIALEILSWEEMIAKVKELEDFIAVFFDDPDRLQDLLAKVQEKKSSFSMESQERFQDWLGEASRIIHDEKNKDSTNKVLMAFDSANDQLLGVCFDRQLDVLARDAQFLTILGYSIPYEITQFLGGVRGLAQKARALEQIAAFHNTIDQYIIPSIRPILLDSALVFSSLVKVKVDWSNDEAIDAYIRKLERAAERLNRENGYLTEMHNALKSKVATLFQTDLLRQRQKWKDILNDMRYIFAGVEKQGYRNLKAWKLHWDAQLYKALDSQFEQVLRSIHDSAPAFTTELVVINQELGFKPSLENLHEDAFEHVRRFLTIPSQFKGVSDEEGYFSSVYDRHTHEYPAIYVHFDKVTEDLEKLRLQFSHWSVLIQTNFDSVMEENLTTAEDWDLNFRVAKAKAQEFSRMEMLDRKFGHVTVSLLPLQRQAQQVCKQYWNSLVTSLRSSIITDVIQLDDFVETAMKDLNAVHVEEISMNYARLVEELPKTRDFLSSMEERAEVLRKWTSEEVRELTTSKSGFENLATSLESYEVTIAKRVELATGKIERDTVNLESRFKAFLTKWLELKPSEDLGEDFLDSIEKSIKAMYKWEEEFQQLELEFDKIKHSRKAYGLDSILGGILDSFKKFEEGKSTWNVYKKIISEIAPLCNTEWLVVRNKLKEFDKLLETLTATLEGMEDVPRSCLRLVDQLKDLSRHLRYVKGDGFSENQWLELYSILHIQAKPIERLTFRDILQSRTRLMDNTSALKGLSTRAAEEAVIRQGLLELDQWEFDARIALSVQKDSHGKELKIVKEFKEPINKISEHQSMVASMKTSPFASGHFVDRIVIWEQRLGLVDFVLRNLTLIQRKWLYLEPLYGSGPLSQDYGRFRRIDNDFRNLMTEVARDSKVASLTRISGVKELIGGLTDHISKCMKKLNDFLEQKRKEYSNFYFLGDDDLLEIIGQSSNPAVVQNHLHKFLSGVNRLVLDESGGFVKGVCSAEGEVVTLQKRVRITDQAEVWLRDLGDELSRTLKHLTLKHSHNRGWQTLLLEIPIQVLSLVLLRQFTEDVENAIQRSSLSQLLEEKQKLMTELTSFQPDRNNTHVVNAVQCLVCDFYWMKNVVTELINERCSTSLDWVWLKQLRAYVDDNNQIIIKMADADFQQSFEYQGSSQKLVHTTLTNRCYLTLTQALRMGLGGNPYGPAGTGKTESVKALGAVLGRQVVVFNCDEGLDVQAIGRIFIGLARSGAWGCFDEFNRLDMSTLSAVATLIKDIQGAVRSSKKTVRIQDVEVNVHPDTAIFITLNPASKGYQGRSKLPDNLKQLFRPVLMAVPDSNVIAEVILLAEGFTTAREQSEKVVRVYKLASNLLTRQRHYDWGLRALKGVLNRAGALLRSSRDRESQESDSCYVLEAIEVSTLSKLSERDAVVFDDLLKDVFRYGAKEELNKLEEARSSFDRILKNLKLELLETSDRKLFHFREQILQRHGVVVVGPTLSGKSSLWKVIAEYFKAKLYIISPKAVSRDELLGYIDETNRQWTDGIFTKAVKEAALEDQATMRWIVFDGEIDPEWIESLNSILDDNRLLTLPSGERVKFDPNMKLIFETDDLSAASPATMTRLGVVLTSHADLNFQTFLRCKLLEYAFDGDLSEVTIDMIQKTSDWLRSKGVNVNENLLLKQMVQQLRPVKSKDELMLALFHAFEALAPRKEDLLSFMSTEMREEFPDFSLSSPLGGLEDETSGIFSTHRVVLAVRQLKNFLDNLEKMVMIIGPRGCGKSCVTEVAASEIGFERPILIKCTKHLTPRHILRKLKQVCSVTSAASRKILKPLKKGVFVVLQQLDSCQLDKWKTSAVEAFLYQISSYGGFYDDDLEWTQIEGVSFVCTAYGKTSNSRLYANSAIIHMDKPAQDEERYLIERAFKGTDENLLNSAAARQLAEATYLIFQKAQSMKGDGILHRPLLSDVLEFSRNLISRYPLSQEKFHISWSLLIDEFYGGTFSPKYWDTFLSMKQDVLRKCFGKDAVINFPTDTFLVMNLTGKTSTSRFHFLHREEWSQVVEKAASQYCRDAEIDDFSITPEILSSVALVDRTCLAPSKTLLWCAKSGYGRKTALRILASLRDYKVIVPSVCRPSSKTYLNELRNSVNRALKGESVIFVVEDFQVRDQTVLELLASIVCNGDLPHLMSKEETEQAKSYVMSSLDGSTSAENVFSLMQQRIKEQWHLVILADCSNSSLISAVQQIPSLSKYLAVRFEDDWSADSYKETADSLLNRVVDQKISDLLVDHQLTLQKMEEAVANPLRFLATLKLFCNIFQKSRGTADAQKKRLEAGVSRLEEVYKAVFSLKESTAQQGQRLAVKQREAKDALDMISFTMRNANQQKVDLEQLKEETKKKSLELEKRKLVIKEELAKIEPLILDAQAAVGNIRPESLTEIRSLRAPPEVIRDILEGVLRLMGVLDTSWNSMKQFLAKRGIREEIRNFDARSIKIPNRKAVEKLLEEKPNSFDETAAKRASVVAHPLATWVKANVDFAKILDKLKPLEDEQATLNRNLELSDSQMSGLLVGLENVDASVQQLQAKLSEATREAAELEIGMNRANDEIRLAETLVGALQDEYERWRKELTVMSEESEKRPVQCHLAAAYVHYLSSYDPATRCRKFTEWCVRLDVTEFDVSSILSVGQTQTEAISSGLSQIDFAIIKESQRPCLIVDPNGDIVNKIREKLSTELDVVSEGDPKLSHVIHLAVRFGKVLLIKEIEEFRPIIPPLFDCSAVSAESKRSVVLDGKPVACAVGFRLILATSNPQYSRFPSSILSQLTVLDFGLSEGGVIEEFCDAALSVTNPEHDEKILHLEKQGDILRRQLDQLEDSLLTQLSKSHGNILQDQELLNSLRDTKASSTQITDALSGSKELQGSLRSQREKFRDVARFASRLFFAIKAACCVHPMYGYSKTFFKRMFQQFILGTKDFSDAAKLARQLTESLYCDVIKGVFVRDRTSFGLLLVKNLSVDVIDQQDWDIFAKKTTENGTSLTEELRSQPRCDLNMMAAIKTLRPDLYTTLDVRNSHLWEGARIIPPDVSDRLTPFERVLTAKAVGAEELESRIEQFIQSTLGVVDLHPSPPTLQDVIKKARSNEPILLILPVDGGSDPSSQLQGLAQSSLGPNAYTEIPLGDASFAKIEDAIQKAIHEGGWICLKNIHLAYKWIQNILNLIDDVRSNFRLILTSEFSELIPSNFCQRCHVLACESPKDLRHKLQRFWEVLSPLAIANAQKRPSEEQLSRFCALFALALLQAIITGRNDYSPQGWTRSYEFTGEDLRCAASVISRAFRNEGQSTERWKFISGLTIETIFGGRISDAYDYRALCQLIRNFFRSQTMREGMGLVQPLIAKVFAPTVIDLKESFRTLQDLTNRPELFGLPRSASLPSQALKITGIGHSDVRLDRKVIAKEIVPLLNCWKHLNEDTSLVKPNLKPNQELTSPMSRFIASQVELALDTVKLVHRDLSSMSRFLKAAEALTDEVTAIVAALLNNEVPDSWHSVWEGPSTPLDYLTSVTKRGFSLVKLLNDATVTAKTVDLSALMTPAAVFDVMRQETARASGTPIEELHLTTHWTHSTSLPPHSYVIRGLVSEGFTIRDGFLTELNSMDACDIACGIAWTKEPNGRSLRTLQVPVYSLRDRSEVVTELSVDCDDAELWTVRNVSFYVKE